MHAFFVGVYLYKNAALFLILHGIIGKWTGSVIILWEKVYEGGIAMINRIILLLIGLLLIPFQLVQAHSGLESADPAPDAVVERSVQNLTLFFNTKIEQNSSFQLFNDSGNEVQINNRTTEENMLYGETSEPLSNGKYTVRWNIIGKDGHPIEGEYSFTVKNQEEQKQEQKNENNGTKQDNGAGNGNTEEPENQSESAPPSQTQTNTFEPEFSTPFITLIGGLILIAVVSFGWMVRREKE
ncbi:copper resistance CopC family protein [Pseudalkalibacillus caeni]|uniref:Copper resistance protein CopC n=1 Tax=Exobacillus caeni TaxID=2574798 RepID=A0A5R9F3D7_9BACL|nr:copper resistance CopC family protein [Pseudalkalibacillus caeni]TLS37009.1 copper resistance protein CopC [Pseudalkalibacillus caeni]